MKKLIITFLGLWLSVAALAQANGATTQQFFQLPLIPDSIENFQRRCDFMVTHYWDFCDLKKAFSSRDKMAQAFDTYVDFMPYASASTVFASVDKFMKDVSKKPENALFIAELAEAKLYSDTAEMRSEQLYTRFLDNILAVKKLDKTARERYQKQANILHNSQEGMTVHEFDYTDLEGRRCHFAPDSTYFATLLMLTQPGNATANMAKLRLYADIKTSRLVDSGVVRIVCVAPSDAGEKLTEAKGWSVGYAPGIDEIYDMRDVPMFYIIDSDGVILKKGSDVEPVLRVMELLRIPHKRHEPVTEPADTTESPAR